MRSKTNRFSRLGIAGCLLASGCVNTEAMWANANLQSVAFTNIYGGDRQNTAGPALDLHYTSDGFNRDSAIIVPLDDDGWPRPPFDCGHGPVTPLSWAYTVVSEQQREAIFKAAGVGPIYWTGDRGSDAVFDRPQGPAPQLSVIVVGYVWDRATSTPRETQIMQPGLVSDHVRYRDDPDMRLVVIPADVPTDAKERADLQSHARWATPGKLAEDAGLDLLVVTVAVPLLIIISPALIYMDYTMKEAASNARGKGWSDRPPDAVQPPQTAKMKNGTYVRPLLVPVNLPKVSPALLPGP